MARAWHNLSSKEVFAALKSRPDGLTSEEAEERLKIWGPNRIPEAKRFPRLLILFNQFKTSLVYLLLIAAGVSFFILHEGKDAAAILAAVVLTVIFGFWEEFKAEKSLEQLKKAVKMAVRVFRGGQILEIDSDKLVPGDVVFLTAGDKVPADGRLFEIKNFAVNEAILTGESMPISKIVEPLDLGATLPERKNMVYMGATVVRGVANAVIVSTGLQTEFGAIAAEIKGAKEVPTPLQKKIANFSSLLTGVIVLLTLGLVILGFARGFSLSEILPTALAAAVATIPEGLVVTITVILIIGMRRLLKKNALIRRLVAAETIGSTTVICVDKTGTITEGEIRVAELFTPAPVESLVGPGQELVLDDARCHELALKIAVFANDARIENPNDNFHQWRIFGDPTDKAMILAAVEAGLKDFYFEKEKVIIDDLPFESENQYAAVLVDEQGVKKVLVKGAFEKLIENSRFFYHEGAQSLTDAQKEVFKKKHNEMSRHGLRVIAVGYRRVPDEIKSLAQIKNPLEELMIVGLIGLKDALRPSVGEALDLVRKAGIKVIMITGDNEITARAIGKELGFTPKEECIIEGRRLAKLNDDDFYRRLKDLSIYARILPKEKLRIVDALQKKGEVVAMTGDGINDAPALRQADIGIAVGGAADAAKETSDMVLLDNNFKTIVAAVEEGRRIFDNIRKVMTFLISDSFCEIILIGGSLLIGLPLPLTAIQILWVNIIEDSLPSFALAFEPAEKDVMSRPPRHPKTPIIDSALRIMIAVFSISTSIITFGLFWWFWTKSGDIFYSRTMAFVALGINSLFYIFSLKNLTKPIFRINPFSNLYLVGAVMAGLVGLALPLYIPALQSFLRTLPLNFYDWLLLFGLGFVNIAIFELAKIYYNKDRKDLKI